MNFSILNLLALTAFIAWIVATLAVFPDAVATTVLIVMNPLIAAVVVAVAVYGQGRTQSLALGASIPLVGFGLFNTYMMMAVAGSMEDMNLAELWKTLAESATLFKGGSVVTWVNALLCGVTTVFSRRFLRLRA